MFAKRTWAEGSWATRISYFTALATTTDAVSLKETA